VTARRRGPAAVRDAFGADVFFSDGTLNRKALANVIFKDESARERLNALLHPLITDRVRAKLDAFRAQGRAAALLDVPLLFETGMDRLADAVVCVTAPEETRVRRVCRRDRLTREEALRRIRSQNPSAVTESLSDYVLSTDAPYALTRRRARELWQKILADGPLRPVG
jgi:dephospho-CoA kinase